MKNLFQNQHRMKIEDHFGLNFLNNKIPKLIQTKTEHTVFVQSFSSLSSPRLSRKFATQASLQRSLMLRLQTWH